MRSFLRLGGMREVKRMALVAYTPAQMFALVDDIERYPEFVPWVARAEVLERRDNEVTALLEMERAGVKERFTTRNSLHAPDRIDLQLVDGPFRVLEGRWTFDSVRDRGTKIELWIRFEFSNPVTSLLLSRSFEKSCGQMVDAFTTRARTVYAR
jgi:ribosome-associated toxin RatA of RatAB toxin-antitoxin module